MNKTASRKLELSECLKNLGPLKAKIEELIDLELKSIEAQTTGAVHIADVDELNKHILQKLALQRVFLLIEELKEELHPDGDPEDDDNDLL